MPGFDLILFLQLFFFFTIISIVDVFNDILKIASLLFFNYFYFKIIINSFFLGGVMFSFNGFESYGLVSGSRAVKKWKWAIFVLFKMALSLGQLFSTDCAYLAVILYFPFLICEYIYYNYF